MPGVYHIGLVRIAVVLEDRERLGIAFSEVIGVDDTFLHAFDVCVLSPATVAVAPVQEPLCLIRRGLGVEHEHRLAPAAPKQMLGGLGRRLPTLTLLSPASGRGVGAYGYWDSVLLAHLPSFMFRHSGYFSSSAFMNRDSCSAKLNRLSPSTGRNTPSALSTAIRCSSRFAGVSIDTP